VGELTSVGFLHTVAVGGIGVNLKLIMNRIDAESAKKEEGVVHGKTPFQPRCVKYLHL
jgi:hypothetical protein